jgi:hypothetical protein
VTGRGEFGKFVVLNGCSQPKTRQYGRKKWYVYFFISEAERFERKVSKKIVHFHEKFQKVA